nr:dynactin subunit 5 [Quercus suber]
MSYPIPGRVFKYQRLHSPPPRSRHYAESSDSPSSLSLRNLAEDQSSPCQSPSAGRTPDASRTRHVRFDAKFTQSPTEPEVRKRARISTPGNGTIHAKSSSNSCAHKSYPGLMRISNPARLYQTSSLGNIEANSSDQTRWIPPLATRQPQQQTQYYYASSKSGSASATTIPMIPSQPSRYPDPRLSVPLISASNPCMPSCSTDPGPKQYVLQPYTESNVRAPVRGNGDDDFGLSSLTLRLKFGPSGSPKLVIKISMRFERGKLPQVKVRSRRPAREYGLKKVKLGILSCLHQRVSTARVNGLISHISSLWAPGGPLGLFCGNTQGLGQIMRQGEVDIEYICSESKSSNRKERKHLTGARSRASVEGFSRGSASVASQVSTIPLVFPELFGSKSHSLLLSKFDLTAAAKMSRPSAVSRRSAKSEYIETDTGNKISRRSILEGKQNIMLGGKSVLMAGVHLRGDLVRKPDRLTVPDGGTGGGKEAPVPAINIGRATIISTNCTLRPPMRLSRGTMTYYPLKIGDNVFVGPGSHISAAAISSNVWIGAGCVLQNFCTVRDHCKILPGTVVPPYMMVPPGSVVAGRPGRIVGEVGEGWGQGLGPEGEEFVEGGDLRPLVRIIK